MGWFAKWELEKMLLCNLSYKEHQLIIEQKSKHLVQFMNKAFEGTVDE